MVQINGKYQLVKNENFVEYLVQYGIPKEKAEKVDALKPVLEVALDGKTLKFTQDSGIGNPTTEFTLGKEVEEKMPLDFVLKSTATEDGNKITITSIGPKGEKGKRVYEFTDTELVLTMTSLDNNKAPIGKRYYKRL